MESDIRMVRKRFKCSKCGTKQSKLVTAYKTDTICENCGYIAYEMPENEFGRKTRDEVDQTYRIIFDKNQSTSNSNSYSNSHSNPQNVYHNRTDLYDRNRNNIYGDTRKQFKREILENQESEGHQNNTSKINSNRFNTSNESTRNTNSNRSNNTNNTNQNSNTHGNTNTRFNHPNNNFNQFTRGNFDNYNIYENTRGRNAGIFNSNRSNSPPNRHFNEYYNSTNNRNNNHNNIFSNIFGNIYENFGGANAFNPFANERDRQNFRRNYQDNRSRVDNDYYNTNNQFNRGGGFFNDFFSNFGIDFPFGESPFMGRIFRHNFDDDIFAPEFELFGATNNNFFRDNFSSNFRSNFGNDIGNIADIFEMLRNQTSSVNENRHKATSDKALNNLKKFKMNDKYCKKSPEGKLENPNCCICISDINMNEETVLLPCGHLFHWSCVLEWLKQNNTCPVCRFELQPEGR